MLRQDHSEREEMVKAILSESGMSEPAQQLIKAIFKKQQQILIALEDTVRNIGYRDSHVEKRLDELLEKVDPEEFKKRKQNCCESAAGTRLPGGCLI